MVPFGDYMISYVCYSCRRYIYLPFAERKIYRRKPPTESTQNLRVYANFNAVKFLSIILPQNLLLHNILASKCTTIPMPTSMHTLCSVTSESTRIFKFYVKLLFFPERIGFGWLFCFCFLFHASDKPDAFRFP